MILPMVPYELEREDLRAQLRAAVIRERAHIEAYTRLNGYTQALERRLRPIVWRAIRRALGL